MSRWVGLGQHGHWGWVLSVMDSGGVLVTVQHISIPIHFYFARPVHSKAGIDSPPVLVKNR